MARENENSANVAAICVCCPTGRWPMECSRSPRKCWMFLPMTVFPSPMVFTCHRLAVCWEQISIYKYQTRGHLRTCWATKEHQAPSHAFFVETAFLDCVFDWGSFLCFNSMLVGELNFTYTYLPRTCVFRTTYPYIYSEDLQCMLLLISTF